jgi:uncharacterized protein YbaR (Trm112 family)
MIFCPTCANMLVVSSASGDQMWSCQACTYRFPITKQVRFLLPSHPIGLTCSWRPQEQLTGSSAFRLTILYSLLC